MAYCHRSFFWALLYSARGTAVGENTRPPEEWLDLTRSLIRKLQSSTFSCKAAVKRSAKVAIGGVMIGRYANADDVHRTFQPRFRKSEPWALRESQDVRWSVTLHAASL